MELCTAQPNLVSVWFVLSNIIFQQNTIDLVRIALTERIQRMLDASASFIIAKEVLNNIEKFMLPSSLIR